MNKVSSPDGTPIAFDRLGDGQSVIVVGGAMCDRALTGPTAKELAKRFTVINYDRRGRGDSGDTAPYAVERELHEPAFVPYAEEERRTSRKYAESIKVILSEGHRGDAVKLFFATVGMPQEMVDEMRQTPRWAELEAMAPTLAYDSEVMGDRSTGGTVPTDLVGRVTTESLVLVGGASPAWMIDIGRQIADVLPNGRHRILVGQEHVVTPEVLVPVLAEFFAG